MSFPPFPFLHVADIVQIPGDDGNSVDGVFDSTFLDFIEENNLIGLGKLAEWNTFGFLGGARTLKQSVIFEVLLLFVLSFSLLF